MNDSDFAPESNEGMADGEPESPTQIGKSIFTSGKFQDAKDFAKYLGIPLPSLQMLMKDF